MSYVDHIIKYLSGDLSQEEAAAFEKALDSDKELKREFEEQAAAYDLIKSQLQKKDNQAFTARLQEAMSRPIPEIRPGATGLRRWWYFPSVAASILAILFITLFRNPGNDRILARHYQPAEDPVVLALNQGTRGDSETGISQYRQGNYAKAMELLVVRIAEDSNNKLVLLYYLLSAIELDRQMEALELVTVEDYAPMELLDQSLSWYSTLALIKSDMREAALEKLRPLTRQEGPYQSDAIKLEKVLLK